MPAETRVKAWKIRIVEGRAAKASGCDLRGRQLRLVSGMAFGILHLNAFRDRRRYHRHRDDCHRRRIRISRILRKRYGTGRWRKLKGAATVRLTDGTSRRAEVHWFEAHGIGKKMMRIKRFLD